MGVGSTKSMFCIRILTISRLLHWRATSAPIQQQWLFGKTCILLMPLWLHWRTLFRRMLSFVYLVSFCYAHCVLTTCRSFRANEATYWNGTEYVKILVTHSLLGPGLSNFTSPWGLIHLRKSLYIQMHWTWTRYSVCKLSATSSV